MTIEAVYKKLLKHFGPQNWWPADSPFEVMVGAILTQQTSWRNVEKAIQNLKKNKLLSSRAILTASSAKLERAIRPSGYFRQKAKKLKLFCRFFQKEYRSSVGRMAKENTHLLRQKLLGLWGIGPETADSILLYALNKPVFVVDAYTIRIGKRTGMFEPAGYEYVRQFFESKLPKRVSLYKEYHALLVELGKNYCRPKPRCGDCPVFKICRHFGHLASS